MKLQRKDIPSHLLKYFKPVTVYKPKDDAAIPQRLYLALQSDGWWMRSNIMWAKVNAMPSSQRDRPTVSHEYIFLMSKARKYYYDQEAVKLPHSRDWTNAGGSLFNAPRYVENPLVKGAAGEHRGSGPPKPSPSGRIRRTTDWWFDSLSDLYSDEFLAFVLPTEPFTMEMCKKCKAVYNRKEYRKLGILIIPAEVSETGKEEKKRICAGCGSTDDWLSHFATFGEKLVRPMVLAGSSPKVCPHCGAGWKRVVEKGDIISTGGSDKPGRSKAKSTESGPLERRRADGSNASQTTTKFIHRASNTVGWQPSCSCENNDGSAHAVVLDPFAGSGTTCAVAKKLGRAYVGIEQNSDYCTLAEKRIAETVVDSEEEDRQLDLFR